MAERRDAEQARRRLEGHVATWEQHDRTAAFLDDVQLREAERWLASPDARELGIPRGLSELVAVSAAKLRRRRRLRRGAIAGLVGLLLAAIVLAGVFLRARNDANHRANVALSRERAASALAELSVDPRASLSLALEAVARSLRTRQQRRPTAGRPRRPCGTQSGSRTSGQSSGAIRPKSCRPPSTGPAAGS